MAPRAACARSHVADHYLMKMQFVRLAALSAFALALVCAQDKLQADTVVTTTTTGLVSEATPDDIVIRTEADPVPIRYFVSRHTTLSGSHGRCRVGGD